MNFLKFLTPVIFIIGTIYQNGNSSVNLKWKLTGIATYTNLDSTGTDTIWKLKQRDTIIYNEAGEIIFRYMSKANSGWNEDSLLFFSKKTYLENKVVHFEVKYFNDYKTTTAEYKEEYHYFNNDKSYILSASSLRKDIWELDESYSCTVDCCNPVKTVFYDVKFNFSDFLSFRTKYRSSEKIAAESTDTTISLKERDESNRDKKQVRIYNKSVLKAENLVKVINLEKNQSTGKYETINYNLYKQNGHFRYTKKSSEFVPETFLYKLRDMYNNDTLECEINYNNSPEGDTSSYNLYKRKYDEYGNNIETILFEMRISDYFVMKNASKIINTYTLQQELPASGCQHQSDNNIKFDVRNNTLKIFAPNISKLKFYNLSGQKLFVVDLNGRDALSINITDINKKICPGFYYIQMQYGNNMQKNFPLLYNKY